MAITTGTIVFYDKGKGELMKSINFASSDLRILLAQSGYTPNTATHDYVNDITNEVGGGIGYTRYALTETWTEPSAGVWMLDSNNPTWSASGGNIVARYWVMYEYNVGTDSSSPLICYGLLDNTPADVTALDGGDPLEIIVPTTGWFRLS